MTQLTAYTDIIDTLATFQQTFRDILADEKPYQPPFTIATMENYKWLEKQHLQSQLIRVLRDILHKTGPDFLIGHYGCDKYLSFLGSNRYPWVDHRCRHIAKKGQQEFIKYHC